MIIDTFLFQMFPKRVEIVGDVFGFGTHGTTGINHKQNVGGPRSFFGFYFGFGCRWEASIGFDLLGICGGGDDGGQEEKEEEEEEEMKEERGRCCASSFACGHDAMANSGAVKMGWHRRRELNYYGPDAWNLLNFEGGPENKSSKFKVASRK